jgi:catechol 2,3-dioxygenase-like lactoylglutathione lyase family enzyme
VETKVNWSIHHVNIPAHNVRESVAFFRDIIGLPEGQWKLPSNEFLGNFRADPDYLAIFGDNSRGIHIVKPVPEFAKNNGLLVNPTIGGHFAITVPDIAAVKARLDKAGIMYSEGGRYAMEGVTNIYLYDPSMNIIEVNQMI